jgi:hypothetical protein
LTHRGLDADAGAEPDRLVGTSGETSVSGYNRTMSKRVGGIAGALVVVLSIAALVLDANADALREPLERKARRSRSGHKERPKSAPFEDAQRSTKARSMT